MTKDSSRQFGVLDLGDKVKYKVDGNVYTVVGFDKNERGIPSFKPIAIDIKRNNYNISKSEIATSYIETEKDYFGWVSYNELIKL